MATTYMTASGLQKLKEELQHLESVERPRVIAAIAEAREKGDLSENAEYDAAKDEQGHIEGEIIEIEAKLRHAKIIDENAANAGIVVVGSEVKILNYKTNKELTYRIVGTTEADPFKNKISNESPVGKALLGHKEGEVVDVAGFSKAELKRVQALQKANITVRNFPENVQQLRKRLKLADGGDNYIFATTLTDNSKVLVICKKSR